MYSSYVTFEGRATRSEYWWFVLFTFIVTVLCGNLIIGSLWDEEFSDACLWGIVYIIFLLVTILPGFALQVRRLHDTGNSGWWILIILAPCVGRLILLIFSLMESTGDNKYGPEPSDEEDEEDE